MDKRTSKAEREGRVTEMIKELGLKRVQNNRIGFPGTDKSLSGGERKRLAFATEVWLGFCGMPFVLPWGNCRQVFGD